MGQEDTLGGLRERRAMGNGGRKTTTMSGEMRIRESAKRDGLFVAWRAGNGGGR
jgi:hypothetical protein